MSARYFLFAGESSGDLHGSTLMQALQNPRKELSFFGVGGPCMRNAGLACEIPMENFQAMGFSDVLIQLPRLYSLFYQVRDVILKKKPDCAILIDYPGFNLRLAKAVRRKGFKGKIIQYICPTVWAHGKKRIAALAAYFDLLLTIYPFEQDYFSQTPLKVSYIGNPLAEGIRRHVYQSDWLERFKMPPAPNYIALFPGSRPGEIKRHLPFQLEVAYLLKKDFPDLCFAISCAQDELRSLLLPAIHQSKLKLDEELFIVPSSYRYELMKKCRTALAKSGTATLELALHSVPTAVHYELSWLNHLFAKQILRLNLPYYCIVNILGNRTIFPEMMGKNLSIMDFKKHAFQIHSDPLKRREIQTGCAEIARLLGNSSAQEKAAAEIMELMDG